MLCLKRIKCVAARSHAAFVRIRDGSAATNIGPDLGRLIGFYQSQTACPGRPFAYLNRASRLAVHLDRTGAIIGDPTCGGRG